MSSSARATGSSVAAGDGAIGTEVLPERIRLRDRLSVRLLLSCMAAALLVGILLSLVQIALDARRQSQDIDETLAQLISMVRRPATEAAYNIDAQLAGRVVEGLANFQPLYAIQVLGDSGDPLADFQRPRAPSRARWMTDLIFGAERHYSVALRLHEDGRSFGVLRLSVDTLPAGRAFLDRARWIVLTGLLRALLLACILLALFMAFLTRPLTQLLERLSRVDAQLPQRTRLPLLRGHERDELGLWVRSANRLLQAIEDHLERREQAEAQACYLEQFDRLTDLPNRTLFLDRLGERLRLARRENAQVAVVCVDVCDFQEVNEHLGYAIGDQVLQEIGRRLVAIAGDTAVVARLGGDQFALACGELRGLDAASALVQRLVEGLRQPFVLDQQRLDLACNCGVSVFPDDATDVSGLMQNVEKALSSAKLAGAAQVRFYVPQMGERMRQRRHLQRELRQALARHELAVHYQPQFRTCDGVLVGAEALLRWQLAGTWISPADFIPIAEESGLIDELGRFVARTICRDLRDWLVDGRMVPRISLNVSAVQFQGDGLSRMLEEVLLEFDVPADKLDLEVTETAIMGSLDHAVVVLSEMRGLGVSVSIDDFGTGQSSLNYLRRLPVNTLKIDRAFIAEIEDEQDSALIVQAIINLAHNLKLGVVAEGVETEAQLRYLRKHQADWVQGFLLGRPLAREDFEALLCQADRPPSP